MTHDQLEEIRERAARGYQLTHKDLCEGRQVWLYTGSGVPRSVLCTVKVVYEDGTFDVERNNPDSNGNPVRYTLRRMSEIDQRPYFDSAFADIRALLEGYTKVQGEAALLRNVLWHVNASTTSPLLLKQMVGRIREALKETEHLRHVPLPATPQEGEEG